MIRSCRTGWVPLVLFLTFSLIPAVAAGKVQDFTPQEKSAILLHGPWPGAVLRDPSNRYSGDRKAIRYGKELFFSTALSKDKSLSCATCHISSRAFTDGRTLGKGRELTDRNTLALFNLRLNRWFGWAGQNDNLWAQSIRPILDKKEMALTGAEPARRIAGDKALRNGYLNTFGWFPTTHSDEQVLINIGKALAAYQETLTTGKTSFDHFRDAMAKNDRAKMAQYPSIAKRGLRIFIGKGRCNACHFGPNFTNGEFHNIGVDHFVNGRRGRSRRVDPGRYGGVKELRRSAFNLLGRYNDDPKKGTSGFTLRVILHPRNWGEFRVPSLRNVALTAPYMHNGSLPTLESVILHYSELNEERLHQSRARLLRPLRLSKKEIADLVSFLNTLTERP